MFKRQREVRILYDIFWGLFSDLFVNGGFNFTILQSEGNVEYFIDKLQICKMGLAKTVAPFFKNLLDRLSRLATLFSSKS